MVIRSADCKREDRENMRGCSIGEHVHEGDSEIFVVERGCPTYDDGGTLVEAKPGDVLICPAETAHSIRNNTGETVDIIALIVYA